MLNVHNLSNDNHHRITPVILAGGEGTRLWPISTRDCPKQFLSPNGGQSLLQQALIRVHDASRFCAPVIITASVYADQVESQLAELEMKEYTLLLEPARRNTAAAIASATAWLEAHHGEKACMAVMPSDHVYGDTEHIRSTLHQAGTPAREGYICTFGIAPTHTETRFGYIRRGTPISMQPLAYAGLAFHEKPDAVTAEHYLQQGTFLWNGGVFIMTVKHAVSAFSQHTSALWEQAKEAVSGASINGQSALLAESPYLSMEAEAFDRAIMEKLPSFAVIPFQGEWLDVGTPDAFQQAQTIMRPFAAA